MPPVDPLFTQCKYPDANPEGALDPEVMELHPESPLVSSLRFLDWKPHPTRPVVLGDALILGGLSLAALDQPLASSTWAVMNAHDMLTADPQCFKMSAVFYAMHKAGLFERIYDSAPEFLSSLAASLHLLDVDAKAFATGEFRGTEAFNEQGGRGAVAPGPPTLLFLTMVSFAAVFTAGAIVQSWLPGYTLACVYIMLGYRSRRATRDEPTSGVRTTGEIIAHYTRKWASLPDDASAAVVARKTPDFMAAALAVIPVPLRCSDLTPGALEMDLQFAFTLLSGTSTQADTILWQLIYRSIQPRHHCKPFKILHSFQPKISSVGQLDSMVKALASKYCPDATRSDAYVMSREVDRRLVTQDTAIADLVLGDADIDEICRLLVGGQELISQSHSTATVTTSTDQVTSDMSLLHLSNLGGPIRDDAVAAAVAERAFRDALEAMYGKTGSKRIEAALMSFSIILTRFVFYQPAWLRSRHRIFGTIATDGPELPRYFSEAVAMDLDTGLVSQARQPYAIPSEQISHFIYGRWAKDYDPVNASAGGFLALRELDQGSTFNTVLRKDFPRVESVLQGMKVQFNAMLVASGARFGGPPGATWSDSISADAVFDKQISYIRFCQGLPQQEQEPWLTWGAQHFNDKGLGRAAAHFRNTWNLEWPAGEGYFSFLPADTDFFSAIDARVQQAEPVALVRRAFPTLLDTRNISLPGTTSSTGGTSGHPKIRDKQDRKRDRDKGGPAPDNSKTGPGCKAHFSKSFAGGNQLFLAGRMYDIEAICKKYSATKDQYCWPVLLSNKTGKQALELCPNHGAHGGVESALHKPPSGFDRNFIYQNFSKAANAEQCKQCNWSPLKRSKTK